MNDDCFQMTTTTSRAPSVTATTTLLKTTGKESDRVTKMFSRLPFNFQSPQCG